MIQEILASQLVGQIGWTLLHSLWQIGLVSVALLVVLRFLRHHSPNLRYLVSVSALVLSLLLPLYTFVQISTQTEPDSYLGRTTIVAARKWENENHGQVASVLVQPSESVINSYASTARGIFSDSFGWLDRNIDRMLPFAVLLWILGVCFFSLRLGGGFSQLRRYRANTDKELEHHWQEMFGRLCERIGVGNKIRLLTSTLVDTPIAIGIVKPVIIIPASLFLQISARELETIIAHELIHIHRYDPLVNVAQCMVEALFFYHPGVWWISEQIRREREFAADSLVTDIFEDSHVT